MTTGAGDAVILESERSSSRMKKRSKKEIQIELKKAILIHAKEIQKGKYFIDDINIHFDVIGTGVDKNGCVINEDSGGRTMTIRYGDKSIKIKGEQ